jgi:hypothetical protein
VRLCPERQSEREESGWRKGERESKKESETEKEDEEEEEERKKYIFIAALFTVAKKQKQPKCLSTDKWIFLNVVQVHNGILFSHKTIRILSFAVTWME